MSKKVVDMTNGPLLFKIIVFIIPLLLTNVMQRLYTMADMLIVGRFAGSLELAAVGATTSFSNLILNILIGISVGVSTVTAQEQGAGNKESVNRVVHTSMAISVFGSIIIAALAMIFCKPILKLMGTPSSIIDRSALYMWIILAGYPIVSIYNFGSAIMRAKGDTKSPLIFLTVSGVLNVLLNCVFVINFGMGVEGVALATVISQLVSSILVVYCLLKEEYPYKLNISKIKIYMKEFKRIIFIGTPIAAQSSMFSFSNMVLQSAVNSFGELAVAGAAAATNVDNVLYAILNTPSHAATIFVGQNLGARKYHRVLKVLFMCIGVVLIIGIPCCVLFVIFGKPLLGLFAEDNEVIEYGYKVVQIVASTYFLCGTMEVISGCMKGINKPVHSMISAVSGLFGIRLVWVFTYFAAHRDLSILYLSYPLSWMFVILVDSIMFTICFRKIKKGI